MPQINTTGYTELALMPAFGTVPYEAELTGTGHHWAWATCEWLRHCDSTVEYAGSACNVSKNAMVIEGYCFQSSTSSLECGRMTETADKYHTVTQTTSTLHRCPRGSPAISLGSFVSKRLLVGGCMLSSDGNYSAIAEVHVPLLCQSPGNYKEGCMFPAATNYDPYALQPTACHYRVSGCTNSVAVNYNSEAAIDDGSCIISQYGCTVRTTTTSYFGVNSSTPSFEQRYVGLAYRSVGLTTFASYPAVLNYDAQVIPLHSTSP